MKLAVVKVENLGYFIMATGDEVSIDNPPFTVPRYRCVKGHSQPFDSLAAACKHLKYMKIGYENPIDYKKGFIERAKRRARISDKKATHTTIYSRAQHAWRDHKNYLRSLPNDAAIRVLAHHNIVDVRMRFSKVLTIEEALEVENPLELAVPRHIGPETLKGFFRQVFEAGRWPDHWPDLKKPGWYASDPDRKHWDEYRAIDHLVIGKLGCEYPNRR